VTASTHKHPHLYLVSLDEESVLKDDKLFRRDDIRFRPNDSTHLRVLRFYLDEELAFLVHDNTLMVYLGPDAPRSYDLDTGRLIRHSELRLIDEVPGKYSIEAEREPSRPKLRSATRAELRLKKRSAKTIIQPRRNESPWAARSRGS